MGMTNVKRRVDRALEAVLATLMGAMVLVVLWQVVTRYVLQNPSSVTEELARFGMMWLGLLGASYGFGQKAHLAIEIVPRSQHLDTFVTVAVATFALVILVIGGSRLVDATLALGQTSAALQLERGYIYLALPLSGLLVLFYTIEAAAARHGSR